MTTTKARAGERTQSLFEFDAMLRAIKIKLIPFLPKGWTTRRETYFGAKPDVVSIKAVKRPKGDVKNRVGIATNLLKTIRDNIEGVVAEIDGETVYVMPAAITGDGSKERETKGDRVTS